VQGSEVISLHIMDLTAWKPALDKVRPRILAEDAAALEKWWTELATKVDQFESPKLMGTHLRELQLFHNPWDPLTVARMRLVCS
jgi:hypothetical protein